MHEPYADSLGSTGTTTIDRQQLRRLVEHADAAGLQVGGWRHLASTVS